MAPQLPKEALVARQMTDSQYRKHWKSTGPLEIRMVEKTGKCKHALGDIFCYETPYAKPEGVCIALLHVLDLYTWRVALGFPSWETDDRNVFRIHCPSRNGTVWELRRKKPKAVKGRRGRK
jgi:uncharacterized repeat protein (TIGR04076 family)